MTLTKHTMNIAADSKLWVFQSSRKFSDEEKEYVSAKLDAFMETWNAHGEELLADYDVSYNQFIVIAVDENQTKASGCSIDSLMQIMRDIDAVYKFNLLDRTLISYKIGEDIVIDSLQTFKEKIKNREIDSKTLFFNNGISYLSEYKTSWLIPIEESWLKSLIPQ